MRLNHTALFQSYPAPEEPPTALVKAVVYGLQYWHVHPFLT